MTDAPRPRPTVAVGAFVFDGDRVLLIERGQPPGEGQWTVPGGRQEPGETLAQAVAREVREETGLVVEVGPLACVVERIGDDHHFVILDYLARRIGGTPAPASDARAARFVDEAELATLPLTEGLADVLVRARAIRATWPPTSRELTLRSGPARRSGAPTSPTRSGTTGAGSSATC